jgi:hypothetical protein
MAGSAATPKIIGPLRGGERGWPFGCPPDDVAQHGYVMEEFILDGQATSYRVPAGGSAGRDGRWDSEPAEAAAYATRAYVVRPEDPARFNGTALVNWQNVTAGVDLGAPLGGEVFRGYAWVGVTTQKIGVDGIPGQTKGLRDWDPARYGALHHPGDAWSYDIFSQAGRLVRGGRLLGGLEPTRLLATGGSQSAMRLGSYLNAVHQRDRVFDGFHLTVHWGICPPLEEKGLLHLFTQSQDDLSPATCAIRDDGDVPILVVATECEARYNLPVRQAETDTFRFWEVAGAAHQSPSQVAIFERIMARDQIARVPGLPDRNQIDWRYINDSALRALVDWVKEGRVPAEHPRIEAAGRELVRDPFGNVRGGIRVPELVAPVAAYRGERERDGVALDWLQGQTTPLAAEQLRELYPSDSDRDAAWQGAVDALAAQRLVLPEDVAALRARS